MEAWMGFALAAVVALGLAAAAARWSMSGARAASAAALKASSKAASELAELHMLGAALVSEARTTKRELGELASMGALLSAAQAARAAREACAKSPFDAPALEKLKAAHAQFEQALAGAIGEGSRSQAWGESLGIAKTLRAIAQAREGVAAALGLRSARRKELAALLASPRGRIANVFGRFEPLPKLAFEKAAIAKASPISAPQALRLHPWLAERPGAPDTARALAFGAAIVAALQEGRAAPSDWPGGLDRQAALDMGKWLKTLDRDCILPALALAREGFQALGEQEAGEVARRVEALARLESPALDKGLMIAGMVEALSRPKREPGSQNLSTLRDQARLALSWAAAQGGSLGEGERLEKALASSMAFVGARELAQGQAVDWEALATLAPLQKPALAKALAIAGGSLGRDGARLGCALIECESPFRKPAWEPARD